MKTIVHQFKQGISNLQRKKKENTITPEYLEKSRNDETINKAKIYLKNLIESKGKGNTVEEEIAPIDLGSYCVANSSDKEYDDNEND